MKKESNPLPPDISKKPPPPPDPPRVRKYDDFANRAYEKNIDMTEAMKREIRDILIEFGETYEHKPNPTDQLDYCVESIMNLIFDTRYEW